MVLISIRRFDNNICDYLASIHSAATPIGSFVSGSIMNQWGRKMALLFSIFPLMSGWVVIALSQSHMMILTGRIVAGIGVGILAAPAQVYKLLLLLIFFIIIIMYPFLLLVLYSLLSNFIIESN